MTPQPVKATHPSRPPDGVSAPCSSNTLPALHVDIFETHACSTRLSGLTQPRSVARGLSALNPAYWCASPAARDIGRPTFAVQGQRSQAAIVGLPLPLPPKSTTAAYLPKPPVGLAGASRDKMAQKVTQELDLADAQRLDGRATEKNLRKNIWERALARGGSTRAQRLLTTKLAKLQTDVDTAMADFITRAKQWVPDMSPRDLKRAASNIWPMLCFQALDGKPLKITQAMLGFSMLYPLTDDIIDEPSISKATKKDFLDRFARLISHGDAQAADTPRERNIWQMIHLIEADWQRHKYPLIYRFMGELLQAQINSQIQLAGPLHGAKPVPALAPVWDVTAKKGALSVLCDVYLVKGRVSKAEASFAAHFGVMFQFLNDIRTVDEDLQQGQYTPFNLTHASGNKLDGMVDEVYHHYLTTFTCPEHARLHGGDVTKKGFFGVMLAFLSFKLIEGVAINRDKFSEAFLAHIEGSSPLPLALIERMFHGQYRGDNETAAIVPNLAA